jgi:hypothetical protein
MLESTHFGLGSLVQIQRHYNGREEPPLVGRLLDDVTTGNHLRISIFREGLETTEIFQSEGALLAVFADSVRTEKEWFRTGCCIYDVISLTNTVKRRGRKSGREFISDCSLKEVRK